MAVYSTSPRLTGPESGADRLTLLFKTSMVIRQ